MSTQPIAIIGGTGFVGRHLLSELARQGHRCKVLSRRPQRGRHVMVFPGVELVDADAHNADVLEAELAGCHAVINLAGILNQYDRPGERFQDVHAELPAKIAKACQVNGIERLLHMGALNASADSPSEYLKTKAAGDDAVHAAASETLLVTSIRPSVIFGWDDDFFNRFARLIAMIPAVFPVACPQSRFAPVYVEDVVKAFVHCLKDRGTAGRRYDLCGPEIFTLREVVDYVIKTAGHQRLVLELDDLMARIQARMMEFAPGKPFTRDNYLSLQVDSVCDDNGLLELGIAPTPVDAIVPRYLGIHERNARLSEYRRHAGRG